jgi:hypothetical protein
MPFVRVNKDKTATTQEITEFDTDEDDVIVLDFLHLQPTHLSHSELSDDELQYKHTEAMYWQVAFPILSCCVLGVVFVSFLGRILSQLFHCLVCQML